MKKIILIVALAVFAFSAVKGNALDFYSTLKGLRAVANGKPGTAVYQIKDTFFLVWPSFRGYGMAILNGELSDFLTTGGGCGTQLNCESISDFITHIKELGAIRVGIKMLPSTFVEEILSYKMVLVAMGASTLFTLPIAVFPYFQPFGEKHEV